MTKLRAPLTFENALDRIAGVLGWSVMGELLGKAERTVRDYGDPDIATGISLADAFALEVAYRRAGGDGAPIADCWKLRLAIDGMDPGDRDALHRHTLSVIKEGGEAHAALTNALVTGNDVDMAIARRELAESVSAAQLTLRHLDACMSQEGAGRESPGEGATT